MNPSVLREQRNKALLTLLQLALVVDGLTFHMGAQLFELCRRGWVSALLGHLPELKSVLPKKHHQRAHIL
jgi:hypothetical protein